MRERAGKLAQNRGSPQVDQLLLLGALLGFGLLAICNVSPHEYRATLGTTQRFDGDLEPGDAVRRVSRVFDSMMQSPAGKDFRATVAQPGGEGTPRRSRCDAQVFADLSETNGAAGARAPSCRHDSLASTMRPDCRGRPSGPESKLYRAGSASLASRASSSERLIQRGTQQQQRNAGDYQNKTTDSVSAPPVLP
jgi:hypothetical protein